MSNRQSQREVQDRLGETYQLETIVASTGWVDIIPSSAVGGVLTEVAIQTPTTGISETLQVDLTGQGIPWDVFGSFAWSPKSEIVNFKVRTFENPVAIQVILNREEPDA